jgi:anaerobic selenocysteine-containing dehydrogenase
VAISFPHPGHSRVTPTIRASRDLPLGFAVQRKKLVIVAGGNPFALTPAAHLTVIFALLDVISMDIFRIESCHFALYLPITLSKSKILWCERGDLNPRTL